MKAELYKIRRGIWVIDIVQGVQSFRLDYKGTKKECEWMAKMFKLAIQEHNYEQI